MEKLKRKLQKPKYEYQILINKKVVWHGVDAKERLSELIRKYPKAEIGIKWVPAQGVLIARTSFSL